MKIKLSKSQWEGIGKKAGWIKLAMTHKEIAERKGLAKPCSVHDLITVYEGLQCGNCLALSRDNGQTWEERDKIAAKQKVTKPQNVSKEINASDLYNQFLQEGKKPQKAAIEVLDILTTGAFVSVEEPKRTEMINKIIELGNKKKDDEVSKRRVVKITFSDGDTITTWINGTKKDILKYYLPYGNRGPDQDYDVAHPERVRHAINVEFLDNVEPL